MEWNRDKMESLICDDKDKQRRSSHIPPLTFTLTASNFPLVVQYNSEKINNTKLNLLRRHKI